MSRFHKFQRIFCIVPFWSTLLILIITMVELKRRSASKKLWGSFILIFFGIGAAVFLIDNIIMTGQHWILNVIVSWLICTIANILFVDLQIKSAQVCETTEKSSKKGYLIAGCVIASVLAVGAAFFALFAPSVDIEDTNGVADTSLVTIGLNDLVSSPNHYSAISSYTSYKGSNTTVVGTMKDYDHQECAFSCQKISGVMTVQATKTKCDTLTLDISSQVDSGNMEIVVIVDGQYYDHIPINQSNTVILSNVADKLVAVRIGAESAKMNVTVKRTEG